MSDVAIHVENLSKRYRVGERRQRYKTIRDSVMDLVRAPLRAARSARRPSAGRSGGAEAFWALNGLNFEVARGEVVGVIGHNGAGKSTLLKILSRITDPTAGFAEIRGRVGSLLEVGTGFHQELTGRENIYLNGAILGMKRAETDRKFEEMVEFAGVGQFIDTPVKHYSTGMHLRLAFSVAAHLEPEILLVDEVLAVGDLAFQRKCLGKMESVAHNGRTVLFVSHNLAAIRELCHTSVVLRDGQLAFRGPVVGGLSHYSQSLLDNGIDGPAGGTKWSGVVLKGHSNGFGASLSGGDPVVAEGWLDLREEFAGARIICLVNDAVGDLAIHQRVHARDLLSDNLPAGRYRVAIELPPLWLAPGVYALHFKFLGRTATGGDERHHSERLILDVTGDIDGLSRAKLSPPATWTLRPELAIHVAPASVGSAARVLTGQV
jgi:lipopolysaccharide transport system ATP-binding protein